MGFNRMLLGVGIQRSVREPLGPLRLCRSLAHPSQCSGRKGSSSPLKHLRATLVSRVVGKSYFPAGLCLQPEERDWASISQLWWKGRAEREDTGSTNPVDQLGRGILECWCHYAFTGATVLFLLYALSLLSSTSSANPGICSCPGGD